MYQLSYSADNSTAAIFDNSREDKKTIARLDRAEDETVEDFKFKVGKVLRALNPKRYVILIQFNTDGSSRDTWDESSINEAIAGALNDIGPFNVTKLEVSEVRGLNE